MLTKKFKIKKYIKETRHYVQVYKHTKKVRNNRALLVDIQKTCRKSAHFI